MIVARAKNCTGPETKDNIRAADKENASGDKNSSYGHRYMDWVAMRLAATLEAQSFSSYGGVGHFEGPSSLVLVVFKISRGFDGVA
jgi:hypothetical protein